MLKSEEGMTAWTTITREPAVERQSLRVQVVSTGGGKYCGLGGVDEGGEKSTYKQGNERPFSDKFYRQSPDWQTNDFFLFLPGTNNNNTLTTTLCDNPRYTPTGEHHHGEASVQPPTS